jgi:DNA-binding transcriptional ArsR family regulator
MSDKIYGELDPVFEMAGLLYVSYNFDEVKKEIQKSLSELGFNGEQFYSQNLKVFDQYVQSFQKSKVACQEDTFFFGEKDPNYFLLLLSLINENRSWLSCTDILNDQMINKQIVQTCQAIFDDTNTVGSVETLEDIINFLKDIEFEENAKWKLLCIMQQPQKYILQFIDVINVNLEAYQKAAGEINRPLVKLLGQYHTSINKQDDKTFYKIKNKLSESSIIFPTLIFPVSQMIFENRFYYGLLSDMVMKNGKTSLHSKEALLPKLKALSDSSKLEIITSLKISPKYNLEIAQKLGLTAATMSHHMNALLNCGFVGIEKKDGKVYYHLEEENLKDMIKELEQTLL